MFAIKRACVLAMSWLALLAMAGGCQDDEGTKAGTTTSSVGGDSDGGASADSDGGGDSDGGSDSDGGQ